ncbi:MAG: hypothetical protein ACRET8_00675 [Burkholderiales bacterium]
MSELGTRMAAIASALQTRFPARKVRRSYVDFNLMKDADLVAGVYTVMSNGEDDLVSQAGYIAKDGKQKIRLLAQLRVQENKDTDEAGALIEEAELVMVDEVKEFFRNLPPELCLMVLSGWRQSTQVELPYGWVAFNVTYIS